MSTGRRWQDIRAEAHRHNPALADPELQAQARAELDAYVAGHHLKELRKAIGKTQAEVAQILGVPDAVTFSDLSRNPKSVAERAARLGRLRVTHRDAPDFYLTAADREEQRDESLTIASRIFLALMKHDPSARALLLAMPDVFPWIRHLSKEEARAFTVELVDALSDAAELALDTNAQEVITGWRATARIKADRTGHEEALRPTSGSVQLR